MRIFYQGKREEGICEQGRQQYCYGNFALLSLFRKLSAKTIAGRYPNPVRNAGAAVFEVDLWILSRFLIDRIVPLLGVHPYPLNEQLLMVAAACRIRPGVVFDWGTHIGAS